MKLISLFFIFILSLHAQELHKKGKIDMHGGKHDHCFDNYNSIGGYKDGGFPKSPMDALKPLDKNSTKDSTKSKGKII